MIANLALLHSYILVRVYVRLDNHSKAAPLLIRVSENIDRFPSRTSFNHYYFIRLNYGKYLMLMGIKHTKNCNCLSI